MYALRHIYCTSPNVNVARTLVLANSGFVTKLQLSVAAINGDIIRVHGQLNVTNDAACVQHAHLRLVVDGCVVGVPTAENVSKAGNHHATLYVNASVPVQRTGDILLELQFACSRYPPCNSSMVVTPNDGNQVVAELYREFSTLSNIANDDSARLLSSVNSSTNALVSKYGQSAAYIQFPVYRIDMDVRGSDRDVVRVFGQTTTGFDADRGLDMHGAGLFVGVAPPTSATSMSPHDNWPTWAHVKRDFRQIGMWSTANTPPDMAFLSLSTDAVDRPNTDRCFTYIVTVHGVNNSGGLVIPNGGGVHAMRFSKVGLSTECGRMQLALSASVPICGSPTDISFKSNVDWLPVVTHTRHLCAGDVIRAIGSAQLQIPPGFALPILCHGMLRVRCTDNAFTITSPLHIQGLTPTYETIPIRTLLLSKIPIDATYTIELLVRAMRDSFSPSPILLGGFSLLIVDVYTSCSSATNLNTWMS
jgi:hypothetical protein